MLSKKILFSLVLGISVFILLAYPLSASAQWLSNVLGLPSWDDVVEGIARLIVGAITIIPAYIFFGVAAVTNWILKTLIDIGVSPGVGPSFVSDGWNLSRNLVNMFFLLILVFIGLATILRLREYELQRTLPKLIIIVLLVNFSGLLVGFLADIGNIATVFFTQSMGDLGSVAFSNIFTLASTQLDSIFAAGSLAEGFAGALALGLVLAFFFIFATLAYLAIALIFFLRLVILWVLVILAPFAFAFYILPATRGWWNRWLNALIQWSFITVPLAFFMWLANNVLVNPIPELSNSANQPVLTGNVTDWSGVIGLMLSPAVAIVLLFVGLGLSAGMSGTFRSVRRFAGRAAAVGVGFLGAQTAMRFFAREKRKKAAGESTFLSRLERRSFGIDWRNKRRQSVAYTAATLGMAPLARFATRTAIRKGLEYGAKQKGGVEDEATKLEAIARKDFPLFLERWQSARIGPFGDNTKAAGVLVAARVRGARGLADLQKREPEDFTDSIRHLAATEPDKLGDVLKHNPDLVDDEKAKNHFGEKNGAKMATLLRERFLGDSIVKGEGGNTVLKRREDGTFDDSDARKVFDLEDVQKELGEIAARGASEAQKDQYIIRKAVAKKFVDEMKATDIENMRENMLDNQEIRQALAQWKPWSFIRRIGEEWGAEAVERIQDEAQAMDPELKSIAKTNRSFLRAAYTREGEMFLKNFSSTAIDPETGEPYGEITEQNKMKEFINQAGGRAGGTGATGSGETGRGPAEGTSSPPPRGSGPPPPNSSRTASSGSGGTQQTGQPRGSGPPPPNNNP